MSASRHAADVDAGIDSQCLHSNTIAENSAAGEGAARIDRDNPEQFAVPPVSHRKPIDHRAFARSGATSYADDLRTPGMGKQLPQEFNTVGRAILHPSDQARQRTGVAFEEIL